MKRFIALLMAMVLLMTLTACGNGKAEKYCWNCGEGITNNVSFCPSCGTEQSATGGTTTTSTTVKTTAEQKTTAKPKATTTKKPVTTTQKPTTVATTTKATTTPVPTTTIHTHTYTNYVCSSCGVVDKSHAYEYLREWVKENGKAEGQQVYISEITTDPVDNTAKGFLISYSTITQTAVVQMSFFDYNDHRNSLSTAIDLSSETKNFMYYSFAGDSSASRLKDAYGLIDGKTYTANSPISCISYIGDENVHEKNIFFENTRIQINHAISFLDSFLTQNVPGIDIKDIGFTSF